MEMKRVYILNGKPRAGKDTIVKLVAEHYPVWLYSMADTPKEIYAICGYKAKKLPGIEGWEETKTPEDRAILANLKDYLTKRFDLPFKEACNAIESFVANGSDGVLFLMIREPKEIRRIQAAYDYVKAVLVEADERNGGQEDSNFPSNHADANVRNYQYDVVVHNNGGVDDLYEEIKAKLIG